MKGIGYIFVMYLNKLLHIFLCKSKNCLLVGG